MKKVFLILGTLLLSLSTYAAMNVNKIDPPFWYTGMQNPELQPYYREFLKKALAVSRAYQHVLIGQYPSIIPASH